MINKLPADPSEVYTDRPRRGPKKWIEVLIVVALIIIGVMINL